MHAHVQKQYGFRTQTLCEYVFEFSKNRKFS